MSKYRLTIEGSVEWGGRGWLPPETFGDLCRIFLGVEAGEGSDYVVKFEGCHMVLDASVGVPGTETADE